jgi:hypothetical protein
MSNKAPKWSTYFIWRLCLPEKENAQEDCARAIKSVNNLLDKTITSNVITSGFIGCDTGICNWDGSWPYWNRATFRINNDWQKLADFMVDMRDNCNAFISFHTNITDVNVGLAYYPEMREFFERMRENKCYYTRKLLNCGGPYEGEAYIPEYIPTETAIMPYVEAGNPSDIFAIVNYKNLWESGLAQEIIDGFYEHLPYPPPILYVDVLSLAGNNCNVGYPDGELGGSAATQFEGREKILNYLRSKGTEPGGEGPGDWTAYNWNHGGLSLNDYSRIQSGYCQGNSTWRGEEPMHVYGNQGAYSLDLSEKLLNNQMKYEIASNGGALMTKISAEEIPQTPYQPLEEWRVQSQVVEGFYLTVIQELYHIGKGNYRLPGRGNTTREDEHRGRVKIESYTIHDHPNNFVTQLLAKNGTNTGTAKITDQPWSLCGQVVTGLDESMSASNTVESTVPKDGEYTLIIRYYSPSGGTAELWIDDNFTMELNFPATIVNEYAGDLAVKINLTAGSHRLTLRKGSIHASWSDGTMAKWDRDGFKSWNSDIVFGIGYDRMWPDTWSGEKKIYFYSKDGCERTWKLPTDWTHLKSATLYQLTADGRGEPQILDVINGSVTVKINPGTPYILE